MTIHACAEPTSSCSLGVIRFRPTFYGPNEFQCGPYVSHGPRICIGMRFATAEILVLAVKMLQRFRITYDGPPAEAETDHVAAVKLKLDVAVKLIDRI